MLNSQKLLALAAIVGISATAHAQTYPARSVRMIVGFPAGTGPDIAARVLAQKLQEGAGYTIVVDNKAGAGGLIAAQEAARAPADGYTIMLGEVGQLSIAPSSYNKLPYDVQRDFAPVSQVVSSNFVLLTSPEKNPSKTAKEFAAWSKAQPKFFMATFGAGTPGHFGAFMFADAVGTPVEPVHFKATGDVVSALLNGDVPAVFASVALALPNVKAGKMRALAVSGSDRAAALPDVPTLKEQGFAQLDFSSWFGIVAPGGTPAAILDKLSADVRNAVNAPETKTKLQDMGFKVTGTTREAFVKIIRDDTVVWGRAVRGTGFKAD